MQVSQAVVQSPMSSELIEKYLDGKANVILLREIPSKYPTLDDAFGGYDHIILFTATDSPTIGHWQLIYKNRKKEMNFFDSYGFRPNTLLQLIQKRTGQTFGQTLHLASFLRDAHCHYNEFQYQSKNSAVQTCGRYVVLNLILRYIVEKHTNVSYDGSVFYKIMVLWKKKYDKSFDEITSFMVDKLNEDT